MIAALNISEKYQPYLRIGTCSWKYESRKRLAYDPKKKYAPNDYLSDCAKLFNTIEIDQWLWTLFPKDAEPPNSKVKDYADSTPDEQFSAHTLRKSCIQNWTINITNPKIAQRLAGHAALKTTMQYYCQITESESAQAALTIENLSRKTGVNVT